MATYSQLSRAAQRRWHELADKAQQRYGISRNAWVTLCDAEHVINTWDQWECNGWIQRDEPTDRWPLGRPRRFAEMEDGTLRDCGYVPDRAAGATRRAIQALHGYPDLMLYFQGDCRGPSLYLYSRQQLLERGGEIDSVYSDLATPCHYAVGP